MDSVAYADNLGSIVAGGFVTLAIGLGQKLGLFAEFQKANKSLSSKDLAEACHLKERYVEEWLGSMVASSIVFMDDDDKYYVPDSCKQHLDILKMTPIALFVGEMHRRTMEYFKRDGQQDFKYSTLMPDFCDWLESRINHDVMVKEIVVHLEKFKDTTMIQSILDIGCGVGVLSRTISKYLQNAEQYGVDSSEIYIKNAQSRVKNDGAFKKLSYRVCDAENLPESWTKKFDWVIMFDVLHDLPHPKETVAEVRRVLKDDGLATFVDPKIHSNHRGNIGDLKVAGLGYAISCFVCLPSSSAGESSAENGVGWGEQNKQKLLEDNGWLVKDKKAINNNLLHYAFTCTKDMSQ